MTALLSSSDRRAFGRAVSFVLFCTFVFILPHHAVKKDVSVLSDVLSVSILLGRWIHGGVRRHTVRYSSRGSLGFGVDVGSPRSTPCLLFRQLFRYRNPAEPLLCDIYLDR